MDDIKYLGVQGLEELIILAQNGLAKKADMLQFDVMPDPIKYIGKVVQYVGVSDVAFTRSHFYYSNGVKWTEENISGNQTTQIEMVTALPSWANADPQILYILKDTTDKKMGLYVKNPSVNDSWFTVETSGSFAVVATLPQWADADPSTIYFKADGNILTGYIKKTGTIGAWYTLGGDLTLDAVPTDGSQHTVMSGGVYDALLTKENVSNKVTTVDATATDEQYPSAKAVYDALVGLDVMTPELIRKLHDPDWSHPINISVDQLNGGYITPGRGMIVGTLLTNGDTSTGVLMKVNNVEVARNIANVSDHVLNVQCPVGKGDVIEISFEESPVISNIRFVPYKAQ